MSKRHTVLVTLALFFCATLSLHALTIKVASGAPESSPWGQALNRMAAQWTQISGGQIQMQVFHNGIAGDENDMLRKMRIGQIQAAVFTSIGLNAIADEIMTLSMPLLIRSDDELDYVFSRVKDKLEASVERNRFKALAWSKAGWVRFFANTPLYTPDVLKSVKIAASGESPQLMQAFRLMGYQAIPVSQTELLTSLNSGMVDAFYASPIAAAGYQWFARAPNMLDLKAAPFLGGFIITEQTWRRIPDNIKPQLLDAVNKEVRKLDNAVQELEGKAISTMKSYGLSVTELTDEQRQLWFSEFEKSLNVTVGTVFDKDMYELIKSYLAEYRK